MNKYLYLSLICLTLFSCREVMSPKEQEPPTEQFQGVHPYLMVLGIAQDAGFPQINCKKSCCARVWKKEVKREMVSCISIVDPKSNSGWVFDATPDFKDQLNLMQNSHTQKEIDLKGIFLSHAHIGHYTGLMHLGREAMGANEVPVFAMPRMVDYLQNNGPWSQLVSLKNIHLKSLKSDSLVQLPPNISVLPIEVPHRDEFSETVGFIISTKTKKALFIPDIDKWHKWDRDISDYIQQVDYALLDGSFYQNGEIPGRDMALIPHPFVEESLERFKDLAESDKAKIHFIHFNHTNPVLNRDSPEAKRVLEQGFKLASQGQFLEM